MLRLSALCCHLLNKGNNRLVNIMCHIDCLEHLVLRHLIRTSLDHNYFLLSRSYCKLQVTVFPLLLARVYNKCPFNQPDLCCCTRTVKRNIRKCCSDRGTKHCSQFRTAFRIYGHYHIVKCDIIAIVLREQRTHRTVNHARCQNCILTRLAFPLIKTTWNLSYRVQFFFIFNA